MRTFALIFGLALAAAGGAILYRALFIEPGTGIVVTNTSIREVPDALRTGVGIVRRRCWPRFSQRPPSLVGLNIS